MNGKWSVVWLLLLISGVVSAQGAGAVRRQAESSLLVTGTIEIDQAGRLTRVTLDQREALSPAVIELVETSSSTWIFKPVVVDGRAMPARGPMTLRVVASKLDEDHFRVQIRSATFGSADPKAAVASVKMAPPGYPDAAFRLRVAGTVYLLLRVGRDGKVEDVIAEQTNLKAVAREHEMKALRGMLERPSVAAARGWTFAPPTVGPEAGAGPWVVRVPVTYRLEAGKPKYGTWEAYIPGPRAVAPWADRGLLLAGADAMPDGAVYQLGTGLQLLTPLGPG
jgi:hypothetical protein